MSNWVPVARVECFPRNEGRPVKIGGEEIAVFNINGKFLAIENACPHKGGPLCDGMVSGSTVVCPLHGQRFDLESGMPVLASQPACLTTYPARVEDGVVMVDLAAVLQSHS